MAKLSRGLFIFYSCIAAGSPGTQSGSSVVWQSAAILKRTWAARSGEALTLRSSHSGATRAGVLSIDSGGIAFRFNTGKTLQWPFLEIETFDLTTSRQLVLRTYENKRWHLPGEKGYTFHLAQPVPPRVAAAMAEYVGKPSRDGVVNKNAVAFATIPARHPTHFGGSNGTLRFTGRGIEYTTSKSGDSRDWRWSDIRTLANPDPYHLRIDAYRETYEFLLKEPLSRTLFDKVWDHVYAETLNVSANGGRP